MIADQTSGVADGHAVILPLAALLQKLEMSGVPVDPAQYRSVVMRLSQVLASIPLDAKIDQILVAYPAAAELYENIQYEHAGLCRSSLDASISSEQQTRRLLADIS
jgi:hypothetical protein